MYCTHWNANGTLNVSTTYHEGDEVFATWDEILGCYPEATITGNVADLPPHVSEITVSGDFSLTGDIAHLPSGMTYRVTGNGCRATTS